MGEFKKELILPLKPCGHRAFLWWNVTGDLCIFSNQPGIIYITFLYW